MAGFSQPQQHPGSHLLLESPGLRGYAAPAHRQPRMFPAGNHGLPAACSASRVAGLHSRGVLLANTDQRPLQFFERVLTNTLHNGGPKGRPEARTSFRR